MEKIDGISILVGTAQCNANCPSCAGRQHKKNAPLKDGEINEERLREILDYCWERNCKYITLTGCGEPTLSPESVTKHLEILKEYENNGKKFNPVNLYTNGIRIGSDSKFCETYLPLWKSLGLTCIYISVYSDNNKTNAEAFRVSKYPDFQDIFKAVKENGFKLRTSIILKKGYIDNLEKFKSLSEKFFDYRVDNISAWPLKEEDDSISTLAPDEEELNKIHDFIENSQDFLSKYPNREMRILLGHKDKKSSLGKKIALFQNGEISDIWCATK